MYKIGIDVGGTNTDAVILDHQLNLIHSVKVPTTDDIQTGIAGALNKVLAESAVDPTKVTHAMLGTTQCTNAIVERKKISKSWGPSFGLSSNRFGLALHSLAQGFSGHSFRNVCFSTWRLRI